jgi:hypothetical protein
MGIEWVSNKQASMRSDLSVFIPQYENPFAPMVSVYDIAGMWRVVDRLVKGRMSKSHSVE